MVYATSSNCTHSAEFQVLTHVQNTEQVFQGDYRTCGLFVTSVISLTPTCISHLVALSDFQ
jgi:hypothetical protein